MAGPSAFGIALVTLLADVSATTTTTTTTKVDEPLDRVVAVVGEDPIFLSELRYRAGPHIYRIDYMGGPAAERDAAKKKMFGELVERMVDEKLEAREAERLHITVAPDEIDSGMDQVAKQAKVSKADLLAEAKKQGYDEKEYRAEIARQIIEGKLIQLQVRGRVKVTDAETRAAYDRWVKEEMPIDLRILVLTVAKDATDAAKKSAEETAKTAHAQAKSGTDFCTLVTKYSQDPTTKNTCGSRGPMARSGILKDIAAAAANLKPGELAASPVFFTDPAGTLAYLVIQRAPSAPNAPAVPSFESMKEQMKERAFVEATDRERRMWLSDLRKGFYIEVKP